MDKFSKKLLCRLLLLCPDYVVLGFTLRKPEVAEKYFWFALFFCSSLAAGFMISRPWGLRSLGYSGDEDAREIRDVVAGDVTETGPGQE